VLLIVCRYRRYLYSTGMARRFLSIHPPPDNGRHHRRNSFAAWRSGGTPGMKPSRTGVFDQFSGFSYNLLIISVLEHDFTAKTSKLIASGSKLSASGLKLSASVSKLSASALTLSVPASKVKAPVSKLKPLALPNSAPTSRVKELPLSDSAPTSRDRTSRPFLKPSKSRIKVRLPISCNSRLAAVGRGKEIYKDWR
jgi:hypothetical protein